MTQTIDRTNNYDLGRRLETNGLVEVFEAREVTANAPCIVHRIKLDPGSADHVRPPAVAVMRRYAQLMAPRTPRLVDGWVSDQYLVAVEYKQLADPFSLANHNPMKAPGANRGEIADITLTHMVSMQKCNIIQGNVRPEIFGVGKQGKIYLLDTGLDAALLKCIERMKTEELFSLSTNFAALDLAHWAFWMVSLIAGAPIVTDTTGNRWDDFELQRANNRVQELFAAPDLCDFFCKCLAAFSGGAAPFESATEARKFWVSHKLWSLLP